MDTTLVQLSAQALMLVPIVMAPLLSLAFGIAGAFLIPSATAGWTVLSGIIIGLTAAGLYSGVKTTITPSTGN